MPNAIIDVHTHPLLPTFSRLIRSRGQLAGMDDMPEIRQWSMDAHIEMMDRHGIAGCVLSLPGAANLIAGADGRKLARAMNEELADAVARSPERIGAFAAVPLDDMDAALEETAYALDVLKLDGVSAPTHCQGRYLGMPGYEPWFDEMQRRALTLFVHPDSPPGFRAADSPINVSMLEFMFDTTRMVTHMVLSGSKQRYDRVAMICTHAGGTVPFLSHRIAVAAKFPFMYRAGKPPSADEIDAALASFYFDLTASTSAPVLDMVRSLMPAERLLMGFDYPMMPSQTIEPALLAFDDYRGFDAGQKHGILRGNAERLFARFMQTGS